MLYLSPRVEKKTLYGKIRKYLKPVFHELAQHRNYEIAEGDGDKIAEIWSSAIKEFDYDGCYNEGGYIFNTGEMNPRDVPVENMKAVIKTTRKTSKNI